MCTTRSAPTVTGPLLTGLLVFIATVPATAAAQPPGPLDRGTIGVGLFHSRISLDGRVDVDTGGIEERGRRITEDFDLDRYRPMRVGELTWSPWERHEFGVRLHDDRYRRTIQLSEELRFQGETFPVDVDLQARTRFSTLEVDYTWWAHAGPTNAIGVQLGALRIAARATLEGEIEAPDIGEADVRASVSRRLHAPLIGVAGRQMFGERVRGFAELRAVALRYKRVDGTALSGAAGLEWFVTDHWGVALQWSGIRVRADTDRRWIDGRAELELHGAQAVVKYRW